MKKNRLPRKTKKELKKQILKSVDSAWKTSHVRITKTTRHSRYMHRSAHYKGITVTGYTLG